MLQDKSNEQQKDGMTYKRTCGRVNQKSTEILSLRFSISITADIYRKHDLTHTGACATNQNLSHNTKFTRTGISGRR